MLNKMPCAVIFCAAANQADHSFNLVSDTCRISGKYIPYTIVYIYIYLGYTIATPQVALTEALRKLHETLTEPLTTWGAH